MRGLTLVETMAAAGLISLIVLFTLGLIPSFKMSNRRASTELQAGALAQSYLEQARAAPFDEVDPAVLTPEPPPSIDGVQYRVVRTITDPVSSGVPPQVISKAVRITVTWTWSERELRTFRETVLVRVPRS